MKWSPLWGGIHAICRGFVPAWPAPVRGLVCPEVPARPASLFVARHVDNTPVADGRERIYVDPPDERSPRDTRAVVSWWVVDEAVGSDLERALQDYVPQWLADSWELDPVDYSPFG